MRIIGTMPFGYDAPTPPAMFVDASLHLGFFQTHHDGNQLRIYDLRAMRPKAVVPLADPLADDTLAVDPVHHRVYMRQPGAQINCGDAFLYVVDEIKLAVSKKPLPCMGSDGRGPDAFNVRGISYYAPTNKLYVIGHSGAEIALGQSTGLYSYHESTIIRELDADSLALEWEVDASSSCDTITNYSTAPIVARVGSGIVSYCYVGRQGRAVYIPLGNNGRPVEDNGEPVVRVSPTVGRSTNPLVDPVSGRLLILEDNPPFGPAIWVYDPKAERFFGVIPSGLPRRIGDKIYDYFRGFDEKSGRVYLLNRDGIVLADARHTPLPGGVSYPILANSLDGVAGQIAIDGSLDRLFFPYPQKKGFVVIEDNVPEPVDPPGADPDAGTADIPEVAGRTGVAFSSAASAFGAHVLNTGGFPRLVNNSDQLCTSSNEGVNDRDEFGRCPADLVLTSGNREYFAAHAQFDLGLESGVNSYANALVSPSSDTATDSDARALSRCEADKLAPDQAEIVLGLCPNGEGGILYPLASGTRGEDGNGFPNPGAACSDYVGARANDQVPRDGRNGVGASSVICDQLGQEVRADSRLDAFAFAPPGLPAIFVARSETTASSRRTAEGLVTRVVATATGISIGDVFRIGHIRTGAVTKAKGRSRTTQADFEREIGDVKGPGINCVRCDAREVTEAINAHFGTFMRARIPSAFRLKSPRGYQGVVSKEPSLRASDQAVNDDDTLTVNGLDLIFYNDSSPVNQDGSAGRSRIVIGLAGVQAESRYGIFPLPATSDGSFSGGGGSNGGDLPGGFGLPGDSPVAPDGSGGQNSVPGSLPGLIAAPGLAVGAAIKLVVTNPREAMLLFLMWGVMAFPAYLALRRLARTRRLGL